MPTLAPMSSVLTPANPLAAKSFVASVRIASRRAWVRSIPDVVVWAGVDCGAGSGASTTVEINSLSRVVNSGSGRTRLCSDTLVATASPDQASNSASTASRAGRRARISAANRAAIWSIAVRNSLRSAGASCRDSRCHSTPTPRCLSTAAASAWETSGNRSSSAAVNASSRVSSAAPTTVASRSCLPRKCRYSADGPIATASATSPMATLAYPLRQNRSVAASMISCRRFDGRVPRAGRTTASAPVQPSYHPDCPMALRLLMHSLIRKPGWWCRPNISSAVRVSRILPAPDIGMASTKSTLRGAL